MTTTGTYDVIVVGVGGMGSATVYELASRGLRVLGLERFDIPHDMGSSHGVHRIIRMAYFEDPSYVPLLRRAYERWRELEQACGEQLLYITGGVDAGPEGGEVFAGSLQSCVEHDLPHEVLTSEELGRRFPGVRIPPASMAVYQPDGGFVLAERSIVAHVVGAMERGADVRAREPVLEWSSDGDRVRVETARGSYEAGALVVTGGAWAGPLLPSLHHLVVPERQVLGWFQPSNPPIFGHDHFPVVIGDFDEGLYYALPVFGIPGVKFGRFHHRDETTTADDLNRECDHEDEAVLRAGLGRYFPEADGPVMSMKACMFTNTPDGHFIIDALPDAPNVFVAAGFSGHGYKFCGVIGEIMSDLATRGETPHDISLFRLDRFETGA
ncbi:MAG: N-methyl-L-tryptophan oxidase [Chloroflexota bacterium]|nr:N-methyl-L-tryptophan oxidase [Chloroflexota bacterium]